jgi:hypothetical protein
MAPVAEPKIFLVWHGAPQSATSGMIYVDAAGHELSRVRSVALEKARQNALAVAAGQKSPDRRLPGQ